MRTLNTSKLLRGAAVATLAGALSIGAATTASAQQYRAPTGGGLGSIVSCDAPGNKQVGGALIGALLGGVAGSNLAKNDRGTGTAIGAVLGGATGSYVGCKMQRDAAGQPAYGAQYRPATYVHSGYRLSGDLAPARFERDGGAFVATTTLNLRAAPTTRSARVGSLRAGQTFESLARVRGTEWILVGQNGVGVGYVHGAYVEPAGYRVASYGY